VLVLLSRFGSTLRSGCLPDYLTSGGVLKVW
jgi:hypothetical protein